MDVLEESSLPPRSEIGLPDDKIVYSCSNQLYKYDPETFTTWYAFWLSLGRRSISRHVPARGSVRGWFGGGGGYFAFKLNVPERRLCDWGTSLREMLQSIFLL